MEFIIGSLFLSLLVAFIAVYLKDVTINIHVNYPEPKFYEINDTFNEEGEPLEKDTKATIDDVLKTVNSIMLDREEEIDE